MPSTRRRPNAVASHATAGAMKICEPIAEVESQAPSSKLSENAPRRSGSPTEVSRLSKLARNEPSRTAADREQRLRRDAAARDCGPDSAVCRYFALSHLAMPRLVGVNSRHHRHARQQPLQQRLALVERDADRNTLHHLGEIAGGVVGRQQRELRSAGGRDALDAAVQQLVRESVDRDIDGLARLDMGQLGLLVVGDDVDVRAAARR